MADNNLPSQRVFRPGDRVKVRYIDVPDAYYEATIVGSIGNRYKIGFYRVNASGNEPGRMSYLVSAERVFQ